MNFRRVLAAFAAGFAAMLAVPAAADDSAAPQNQVPDKQVEVMILGTYHFDNPGQDLANVEVDDMLAPRRQREIQILVDSLAQWQPTRVAVENQTQPPTLVVSDYDETHELLKTDRNESVQIGYRLARQLGHGAVYGFDERSGEGEPDYFPFGQVQAFASANGQEEKLVRLMGEIQAIVAEEQAKLPEQSVAQSLVASNREDIVGAQHDRIYYSMLSFGDGDEQPGAELNAFWYMRNAKMFAKIDMIAQAGDRVLVIAGSGHATWLKHFVRRMPGYTLVDALPYVEAAAQHPAPDGPELHE